MNEDLLEPSERDPRDRQPSVGATSIQDSEFHSEFGEEGYSPVKYQNGLKMFEK